MRLSVIRGGLYLPAAVTAPLVPAATVLQLPARSRRPRAPRGADLILTGDFLRIRRHGHLLDFGIFARVPARRFGGRETARAQGPPRGHRHRCALNCARLRRPGAELRDRQVKGKSASGQANPRKEGEGEAFNLFTDANAEFTTWVVQAGILREPFVLVDVGVQGGENPSWHRLADHLVVHGFDAIEEAVDQLQKRTAGTPNRHYHRIAAGNADEERIFYFNPANPTASSMYSQGSSRFDVSAHQQPRSVTVRRLDTLLAEGLIPKADFLKVDVEGFEKDVLLGAANLLADALGVESESNFSISAV